MLQKQTGAPFKPETEETVSLTDEEKATVLQQALRQKIGEINAANYARHIKTDPVPVVPTALQLERALNAELTQLHHWQLDEYNLPAIHELSLYFSGDAAFEKTAPHRSLQKGLLLLGPVGCGKTTLMRVLQKNSFNPFLLKSCREVAGSFAEHGHSAIQYFSVLKEVSPRDWLGHRHTGCCFDDLGTEENKKNYGNEVNVMAEIILNRYDNRLACCKTHLTSNLDADELRAAYGPRAVSRMREMFNIITFNPKAPDRRK